MFKHIFHIFVTSLDFHIFLNNKKGCGQMSHIEFQISFDTNYDKLLITIYYSKHFTRDHLQFSTSIYIFRRYRNLKNDN